MSTTEYTINLSERGRNGGRKRAANMSAAARRAAAKVAVTARWEKYFRENPGKKKRVKK